MVLVHGLVLGSATGPLAGTRYWHAWVEIVQRIEHPALPAPIVMTTVIDNSNGREIALPTALYYRLGDVRTTTSYTPNEARWHMSETGHYGPWPEEDGDYDS